MRGERDFVERFTAVRCVVHEKLELYVAVFRLVGGDCGFDDFAVVVEKHKLLLLCARIVNESPRDEAIALVVHHLELVQSESAVFFVFLDCAQFSRAVLVGVGTA